MNTRDPASDFFQVVLNDEGQHSIWAVDKPIPSGWYPVGKPGPKQDCLEHIGKVWTDMRPRSLREIVQG